MQPGVQTRLASECIDLAEQLQKSFLCQVFRFGSIFRHAQAQAVDASAMQLIKSFETNCVSVLSQPNRFGLGQSASGHLLRVFRLVRKSGGFVHRLTQLLSDQWEARKWCCVLVDVDRGCSSKR